ncbi:hypothetical protein QTP88_007756 [Uroleucon formosanum]
MIDALAFLPLHLVEEGMTYLKNNLPENLTDLLDYFNAYYVIGKYRRIGNEENNIRTKNIVEGWNSRFSKLVSQKHPTIWKLIRKIKNEINADRAKLTIDTLGEPEESRTKRGHNKTVNIRLKELVKT